MYHENQNTCRTDILVDLAEGPMGPGWKQAAHQYSRH